MTTAQIQDLRQAVQTLLDRRCRDLRKPFELHVQGVVDDADWLYFIVQPDRPGVHSEDYIEIARWVEGELSRSHPDAEVLLVPAKPQD
jgi:hypothetical protein